ncbi:hypothetical protein [Kribbella swartbergensis]
MVDRPSNGGPAESRGEGVELPDEVAPDADLRAARNEIRAVGASLREALAADDALAARAGQGEEPGEVSR